MIPFAGKFAEDTVLPLAQTAYDSTKPSAGFVPNQSAFEILADPGHVDFQAQLARTAANPASAAAENDAKHDPATQPTSGSSHRCRRTHAGCESQA
jgi:hypothetical protein